MRTVATAAPHFRDPVAGETNLIKAELRLVTPLKGGGTAAGAVDGDRPVHEEGVRGALREWWRMVHAAQFKTLRDMWASEASLWGSTSGPSTVGVRVEACKTDGGWMPNPGPGQPFGYALAMLRDSPPLLREVSFTLRLTCPDRPTRDSVARALRAWTLFGGYGARTRRGAGALAPWTDGSDGSASVDALVRALALGDAASAEVAQRAVALTRGGIDILIGKTCESPDAAWRAALDLLSGYRQFRNGPMGRSHWPEPDSVRRQGDSGELDGHKREYAVDFAYPRAALGLPIILKFNGGGQHEIRLLESSRLASPVRLKPLVLRGGKEAVPLMLALKRPPLPTNSTIVLKPKPGGTVRTGDSVSRWRDGTGPSLRSPYGSAPDPMRGEKTTVGGLVALALKSGWARVAL